MGNLADKIKGWFGGQQAVNNGTKDRGENPSNDKKTRFTVSRIQPTPNPDSVQFMLNEPAVLSGTKTFSSAEKAKGDPLGEALFGIFGIEDVFLNERSVTITKSPAVGWNVLIDEITNALETHLTFYETADEETAPANTLNLGSIEVEFTPDEFIRLADDQKEQIIDAIFEHSIRPALAYDGGGLTLQGVKGTAVRIHYQGSCGSCPSSRAGTLHYIESILKEHLHPDLQVEAV